MSTKMPDGKTMRDGQIFSARLNNVVTTEREFDELVTKSLPELLDRATSQTKRLRSSNWATGGAPPISTCKVVTIPHEVTSTL